jgi:DNA-directed RNA polymerase sigma subunit (sigma70/sigma32)
MKMTLSKDEFRFQMNQIRPDNFSYEGQGMLFDFLEEIDEDMELDVIAICCDFTESNFQEVANELDEDEDEITEECYGLDEEETAQKIAEYLENKTTVLGVTSDNSIVYLNF